MLANQPASCPNRCEVQAVESVSKETIHRLLRSSWNGVDQQAKKAPRMSICDVIINSQDGKTYRQDGNLCGSGKNNFMNHRLLRKSLDLMNP